MELLAASPGGEGQERTQEVEESRGQQSQELRRQNRVINAAQFFTAFGHFLTS